MEKLDQLSLDVEFLLISVVQAVALGSLATAAAGPLGELRFEYFLYIIASLILILNFWSQAIIHAFSFIDWPLNLAHSFLYFIASFIEVMAFSNVTDPIRWFAFIDVFFIVAWILYVVDLGMIRSRRKKFESAKNMKLYNHIIERQLFEMRVLLPAAIGFGIFSFMAMFLHPEIFIERGMHLILIGIQTAFGIFVLFESISNFKTRARLVVTI